MTPEEFKEKVQPHIDHLFTGNYDLVVTPNVKEDGTQDPPVNYGTIIRSIISVLSNLVNEDEANKKRKIV